MSDSRICDHTSVGVLIIRDGKLLLISRKIPPFGLAAPAGHVDDHGANIPSEDQRYEAAARAELKEEAGLRAVTLTLMIEGRKNNPCSREGGKWHYWRIYRGETEGEPTFSASETKGHVWVGKDKARRLLSGGTLAIAHAGGVEEVALEPVWGEWLKEMNVIRFLT